MSHPDIDQLEVLLLFGNDSLRQGIKIHHDARPGLITAARKLHQAGLITAEDGGYLTDLGFEAAEHLSHIQGIIAAPN
ncbi:DNA-binding protein inhibitor Id-2-like protein [Methylophaga frappieri]|jgi:uncharacterized protein (TIGR02647 family)|uniref:DNA-binding protein inhibitor Id-2-like protein n=1 Tax=Methylophaga frappieri (strain ATCC BAA-2434 / DSM 25690 / JAM7) TaxID=754477 RepID=I1YJL8_METFJ|nr:TIGR02647 family protein [Methylophaga frappieri]AFJ03111.1 DNA-binding protein inhibitor Id-2-like protein [Methylophaga frappieri]